MNYFFSRSILKAQQFFDECFQGSGLHIEDSSSRELRDFMFSLLSADQFKEIYFEIASEVASDLGLNLSNIVLQTQSTPRIFRPGSHGTSFHSDYWYGHGLLSHTVWIPFTQLNNGNTFMVCNDKSISEKYRHQISSAQAITIHKLHEAKFSPVLPGPGEAFIFSSDILHGSPQNLSKNTRLSIDFRIGIKDDQTTTKDIQQYFHFDGKCFRRPQHKLHNKKVLKYVAGGKNKNTFAQHILIEATAKEFGMLTGEQEAEMERFGQPIFLSLIGGIAAELNFEAIIIASKFILEEGSVARSLSSSFPVFCALENNFLNNL